MAAATCLPVGEDWGSGGGQTVYAFLFCGFPSPVPFVCPFPLFTYCVFVTFSLEEISYAAQKMLSDL